MAPRPTWKGFLKIALVHIPIKVYPATESSESLSFNQLHDVCQSRINQRKWCATCAREVPTAEIVKGFEFEPGKYVILLPEELDAIQPPSTRVIDLVQFVAASALDPLVVDRGYYLAPDGPLAASAFAVMRDAMIGQLGIGKLAIYGREYLVAVGPQHRTSSTLMLFTLHHAAEIRPFDDDLLLVAEQELPLALGAHVRLARHILAALTRPLDLADFTDQYKADVRRLIAAKIAGEEIVVPTIPDTPQVGNLRDALLQSLEAVSGARKSPAQAAPVTRRKRA